MDLDAYLRIRPRACIEHLDEEDISLKAMLRVRRLVDPFDPSSRLGLARRRRRQV